MVRKLAMAAALAALLLYQALARAEAEDRIVHPGLFEEATSFSLVFVDEVKDGCMPNPTAVENAFKLELLRSGIKIEEVSLNAVYVLFNGYKLVDMYGCTVSYTLLSWTLAPVDRPWLGISDENFLVQVLMYADTGLVSGPYSDNQQNLEDSASRLGKTFSVKWLTNRQ